MKKRIVWLVVVLALFGLSQPVFAAPNFGFGKDSLSGQIAGKSGYDSGVDQYSLSQTVGRVIKSLLSVVGVLFLALTVYAGFLWMTARGEEEPINKAKEILRSSIIGLVIVLASYGITSFVVGALVDSSVTDSEVGAGADNDGGGGEAGLPGGAAGSGECSGVCITAGEAASPDYILIPSGNKGCSSGRVCARKSNVPTVPECESIAVQRCVTREEAMAKGMMQVSGRCKDSNKICAEINK